MNRSIIIKRIGYKASARSYNLRYMTRRLFIVSGRRRSGMNDSLPLSSFRRLILVINPAIQKASKIILTISL
jgi:hypothetical protein